MSANNELRKRGDRIKAPKLGPPSPKKLKVPLPHFEVWSLDILWGLDVGAWFFSSVPSVPSCSKTHRFGVQAAKIISPVQGDGEGRGVSENDGRPHYLYLRLFTVTYAYSRLFSGKKRLFIFLWTDTQTDRAPIRINSNQSRRAGIQIDFRPIQTKNEIHP
jgi:hypothetical protein